MLDKLRNLCWCVLVVLLLTVVSSGYPVFGQVFSRMDDVRPKVPERWPEVKKYTIDLSLGGSSLSGNIDTSNIKGGFTLKYLVDEKREILVEGNGSYATFNGNTIHDKKKGSFLYIYKWKPGINLFFNSTHAKNSGTKLKYRTTNSFPGICWHQLFSDRFDLFLLSLAPTHESETFETAGKESTMRATVRVNFENSLSESAKLGGDFLFIPDLSNFSDYRVYLEPYLYLSVVPNKYSFKITYANEFDSRPLSGVKKNDYGLLFSFIYHMQK